MGAGTKRVLVLGCTGSIGRSTMEILRQERARFACAGLSAHTDERALAALAAEFSCPSVLTSRAGADRIRALIEQARPDIVVNGIAGSAGLVPSLITLEAGIDLALANKESVVMAGPLIFAAARAHGARILPVDSEHSAIFTLINQCGAGNVESLVITASGGPFRTLPAEKLAAVTVEDALRHPTWSMGAKITIDSATLGNKGLEVIEACRLFSMPPARVRVVVHPQSVVHSLVRTRDGIVYGQLSEPDMKHPILQALDYPSVAGNSMRPFDLTDTADGTRTLTFERPRTDDFAMLPLAFMAAEKDGAYPVAYNAANEAAVAAFIAGRLGFLGIAETVGAVLAARDWGGAVSSLPDVLEADKAARALAEQHMAGR